MCATVISPGVTAFHYKFQKTKAHLSASATQPILKPPDNNSSEERFYNCSSLFDKMMLEMNNLPFHVCIEKYLPQMFHASKCIYWYFNESQKTLYSPTLDLSLDVTTSLPGFVTQTKSVIKIRNSNSIPMGYQNDPRISEPGSPQVFFPITYDDEIEGVIQIARDPKSAGYEFIENETLEFCMSKLKIYSHSIFKNLTVFDKIVSLFTINNKTDPTVILQEQFNCKYADVYQFDMLRKAVRIMEHETITMRPIEEPFHGIVSYSAHSNENINTDDITSHSAYNKNIDSEMKGSFLCVQEEVSSHKIWVIVLREKLNREFTTTDEETLQAILPIVVKAIKGFNETKKTSNIDSRKADLYNLITLISKFKKSVINIGRKIEEAIKLLIEADSAIFFYFDEKNNKFYSKFNNERPIATDTDLGLVSYIFARREAVYYKNPSENTKYLPKIDSYPGYENKCTIGITVCDTRGKAIGVIMGIGNPAEQFDDDDKKLLSAYAIFCGIALENMSYKTGHFKFIEIIEKTISQPNEQNLKEFVLSAIQCAPIRRVALYTTAASDDIGSLNKLYSFGMKSQIGEGKLAETCLKEKKEIIYDHSKLIENGFIVLGSNIITSNYSIKALFGLKTSQPKSATSPDEVRIIVRPIIDKNNNMCIGVLEIEYLGQENKILMGLVDCIEVITFRHIKSLTTPIVVISDDVETQSISVIASQDKQHLFSLDFNASFLTEAEITRTIFSLIESFGLIGNLSIDAIQMQGFLNDVMSLSGKHCCYVMDIVQGCSVMLKLSKYDSLTSKHMVLALFYSLLFHKLQKIDMLRLLTKWQVTGLVEKSAQSSFMKNVIKFVTSISMKNFQDLRQKSLQILTSGEFDPTESESHRFMLFTIIGVTSVCFCCARPQFNKSNFENVYREYCETFDTVTDQQTVLSTAVLPLFSILAKAAPPLANFASNALNNSKRIH
ncbi:hypothetical protein TVAG_400850 [Trichomonas vaginalis G3]|uniref:GAF domain containing protein n=1 Tax=Trichomonas vaginalis (strain ATCC PRA-98 / G3) TaxID=412133 RepID=A2E3J3_TRIV3|nr:cyclic nucleotide phosphodiesterase family [Trichomonas vaginalis G3]EAY12759.1 hypothetical protein TVAG_400850 [Trichomonas vaginalis G3]KAI5539679.1 cyclic nucleotide phosphodiesterase family [Trichomonas vaginalis G3]|eukprot:XP_001324982.1 hypothetical protein [Trichomonas vaginalis G3]